jgi:oxygen-independent coproporphyrinogen-3 oxidase
MAQPLPPLSLYVHIPWCVRKCPYCDFNSHPVRGELDQSAYIDALLTDLELDLELAAGRPLCSIFIGGGTPSLFAPAEIGRLLGGIRSRMDCSESLEITLEANPGTLEVASFRGFREAGVNRLSIGVQSFDAAALHALGRIHGPDEALRAIEQARSAGFERLNLDLMFGLPGQSPVIAEADLRTALELDPGHISYYQLTLEPNTPFHHTPPALPDEDLIWRIQQQGQGALAAAGYVQYEISAYARPGHRCRHNLNYWTFGDYLGIGAGAHGKVTDRSGRVLRLSKWRHPQEYLRKVKDAAPVQGQRQLTQDDLILEFMMNRLRMHQGFETPEFVAATGLPVGCLEPGIKQAMDRDLLVKRAGWIETTSKGRLFLNDLLGLFVGESIP